MSFDLQLTNNDISIMPDGKMRTTSDTPKLRQDILKIITTELGSNKFHAWYGCYIGDNIIGQNLPTSVIEAEITSSIRESLNRLKALQSTQILSQKVSLSEMIAEIGRVFVGRSPEDPRQLNIIITVYTRQLTKIEELFSIIS